ncbi:MAG: hypothetical protein L0Z62_41410 [Gemmataceae bacterium]|nr:hypothetical protein [Gemmataceae bacterium]
MSPPSSGPPLPLPRWLMILGSAALAFHLTALGFRVLSAPSGMWWAPPFGPTMAEPPTFATTVDDVTARSYLYPLKMTHNYHFPTNRPASPGVMFEARFKDRSGKQVTLRFPDPEASSAVQFRQQMLAYGLADDMLVTPAQGEMIPPPGGEVRTVQFWEMGPDRMLRLRTVPDHLVPRNQPVMQPREWSLLLARSYARYLCRVHDVRSVEIVRRSKDPVSPMVLVVPALPGGPPAELVATFGAFGEQSK